MSTVGLHKNCNNSFTILFMERVLDYYNLENGRDFTAALSYTTGLIIISYGKV